MAYNEDLAELLRAALMQHCEFNEKKMFGGLALMVNGHMSLGVIKDDLMIRVGPEQYEDCLKHPNARPMDFTGKPLTGFIYVSLEDPDNFSELNEWIEKSLHFVYSLPPK